MGIASPRLNRAGLVRRLPPNGLRLANVYRGTDRSRAYRNFVYRDFVYRNHVGRNNVRERILQRCRSPQGMSQPLSLHELVEHADHSPCRSPQ